MSAPPSDRSPLHATLIAARREGLWRGVLLRGASGSGKSELALRAMAADWALVADDRVRLWTSGGRLYGGAPDCLAGLIEAWGLGVLPAPYLGFARLSLVVDAVEEAPDDRVPEAAVTVLAGESLPAVRLGFRGPAAVVRLGLALDAALRRWAAL